jgi:hypothetical protein
MRSVNVRRLERFANTAVPRLIIVTLRRFPGAERSNSGAGAGAVVPSRDQPHALLSVERQR